MCYPTYHPPSLIIPRNSSNLGSYLQQDIRWQPHSTLNTAQHRWQAEENQWTKSTPRQEVGKHYTWRRAIYNAGRVVHRHCYNYILFTRVSMFTALIRVNQFRGGNDKHLNQSLRRVYDRHWLIACFSRSPFPSKNQSPFSRLPAVAYQFSLASPQSAISRFLSPHGHQLHCSCLPTANNHRFPVPIQSINKIISARLPTITCLPTVICLLSTCN